MIIERIELARFGKFRDRTIDFHPGLNVVKGPNEAGKSTLHRAVRTALFTKPTATSVKLKEARSWGSEDMFRIGVDFSVDGKHYTLAKDFSTRKALLTGDDLSEPVTDPDAIQERICRWLGCPNEKFFDSTTCIKQDEIAELATAEMAARLQRVVAGGGADTDAREAKKKLNAALIDLIRGLTSAAKNDGRIKTTKDRLTGLRVTREQIASQVAQVEQARRDAAGVEPELAAVTKDIEIKSELVAKNEKINGVGAELADCEKEFARRLRAKALHDEVVGLAAREKELEKAAPPEERFSDLTERSMRLDEKRRILDKMRREEAEPVPPPRPSVAIPIGGAIVMLAGAAAGFTVAPGLYVVALAGLGILIFGITRFAAARRPAEPAAASQVRALESEIDAEAVSLSRGLTGIGQSSLAAANDQIQELRSLRQQRKEKEGELRGTTGDVSWQEFDAQTAGLAPDIDLKRELLRGLSASAVDALEFERIQKDLADLGRRKAALEKLRAEAGFVITHSDVDTDELARIDDEIAVREEEAAVLEHRRQVYEAAVAGIDEAERRTMVTATEALQESMGRRVAAMTDDRYQEVRVDEADMSMMVRSDEKGDWASVEGELSRATQDQFYLAARLGLIELLCEGARPPLLLDDPFVTFDAARRDGTKALLTEMAAERQILLFTCHEDYDGWTEQPIDLGADCGAGRP